MASTASHRKEKVVTNPHVLKPRRRRNQMIGVESSQMVQSHVVDPTPVDDG
jgi:hypothetical protein